MFEITLIFGNDKVDLSQDDIQRFSTCDVDKAHDWLKQNFSEVGENNAIELIEFCRVVKTERINHLKIKARTDCILARFYPGIPTDYQQWPIEDKETWVMNIPYVIAYEQEQASRMDSGTPEGLFNQVLARTDNLELANQVLIRAREAIRMRELQKENYL